MNLTCDLGAAACSPWGFASCISHSNWEESHRLGSMAESEVRIPASAGSLGSLLRPCPCCPMTPAFSLKINKRKNKGFGNKHQQVLPSLLAT